MDNIIHLLSGIDQIYLWDLIGTFVFGISGVLVGLERKMDVFGMFILAFVTLDEESYVCSDDCSQCSDNTSF